MKTFKTSSPAPPALQAESAAALGPRSALLTLRAGGSNKKNAIEGSLDYTFKNWEFFPTMEKIIVSVLDIIYELNFG